MSARTDERRSSLMRSAQRMDGRGPPMHLAQIPSLPYYHALPNRKRLGHSEMFFNDYDGLRSYIAEMFGIDNSELMGYAFGIRMDGTKQVFPAMAPEGPRVVALYMKNGIYGVAHGISATEAIQKLDNVMLLSSD